MFVLDKHNLENYEIWKKAVADEGAALLIDKATDWTSFDAVAKVRNSLKIKKVGHAGTLDPLATGLLIICCGKATKRINEFQELYKVYSGIIKLGATTKTDDAEAEEENVLNVNINKDTLDQAVESFIGVISQVPPKFSARKIKGKRLYELARKNIDFEAEPKLVEVFNFNILNYDTPFITFSIKCSKGTYIRSIARDLGEKLGTGGYLYRLKREQIGDFSVNNAFTISDFVEIVKQSSTNNI